MQKYVVIIMPTLRFFFLPFPHLHLESICSIPVNAHRVRWSQAWCECGDTPLTKDNLRLSLFLWRYCFTLLALCTRIVYLLS